MSDAKEVFHGIIDRKIDTLEARDLSGDPHLIAEMAHGTLYGYVAGTMDGLHHGLDEPVDDERLDELRAEAWAVIKDRKHEIVDACTTDARPER